MSVFPLTATLVNDELADCAYPAMYSASGFQESFAQMFPAVASVG